MMRWQSMHDDVSRALNPAPKRAAPDQFPSAELRRSDAETEDFGEDNEKVAKKLRSLDAEFDAKAFRRPDVQYDRRSASYKQYWGTLRDIYSVHKKSHVASGSNNSSSHQKALRREHHPSSSDGSSDSRNAATAAATAAKELAQETNVDLTTPDDSGSSEDSAAKTVVVHDQALVNALDRLTGIVAKQVSMERHAHESSSATATALSSLTSAITEMRVQQDAALGRLIQLQEQRLHVMEAILQHKLRKEARASSSSNSSSNSSDAIIGRASSA